MGSSMSLEIFKVNVRFSYSGESGTMRRPMKNVYRSLHSQTLTLGRMSSLQDVGEQQIWRSH
jgi:hypothetical protein